MFTIQWIVGSHLILGAKHFYQYGYSVGQYDFVLQVRICTPYAGGFGMAIPNQ
jgi:hypothetical protein